MLQLQWHLPRSGPVAPATPLLRGEVAAATRRIGQGFDGFIPVSWWFHVISWQFLGGSIDFLVVKWWGPCMVHGNDSTARYNKGMMVCAVSD